MDDTTYPKMDNNSKACRDSATQLMLCVEQSPCVAAGGSISGCLTSDGGGDACAVLRRAYFECRRSQLDMRTRIRGHRYDLSTAPPKS